MTRLRMTRLRSLWGNHNFDYVVSMARGFSGGIISLWDPNTFIRSDIWCDVNFVIVKGRWVAKNIEVFMVNVYAPQNVNDKASLWQRLSNFMSNNEGMFALFGDWNAVRYESERCGSDFCPIDARFFNDFIEDNALYELPLGGLIYTWCNKAGSKLSKLDRIFFSNNVIQIVDDFTGTVLPRDFVKLTWDEINIVHLYSNITYKLRLLKAKLKNWIHATRTSEAKSLFDVEKQIVELDVLIDSGQPTDDIITNRNTLFLKKEELIKLSGFDKMQKARIKWDVEVEPNVIKNLFFEYYKNKFENVDSGADFNSIVPNYVLSESEAEFLEREVDNEEIKRAVWDCSSTKAPGPDGFSFQFIKDFWDILQADLCRDIRCFFSTGILPTGANSAFFSLIPKVKNPVLIFEFRPIS
ncbi:uncharacterized protein [Rutidosis leptorrhynchoides]|uniref:uncharacterized protein n=1 Tax=Rutidosis leptorrhynchoides TaxID=125765 RepID=UPI003A991DEF